MVNVLFRFLEDSERRDEVGKYIGRPTTLLRAHDDYPTTLTSAFVEAVFKIGVDRPRLSPLYSTTNYSRISLPDTCPVYIRADCTLSRNQMYRTLGQHTVACKELEIYRSLVKEKTDGESGVAVYYNAQGLMAQRRGDFDEAREYHAKSLAISRNLDDQTGAARSLTNLGIVAGEQGDFESEKEYHKKSLAIARKLEDRNLEVKSLVNLGVVAQSQGNYEKARKYHKQGLAIVRDLGDRSGEAKSLGNLGLLARMKGDFEEAREYHEQSLDIARDLGDRAGEAKSLGNIGSVALKQEDFERAQEYHEQSLAIAREIEDRDWEASSLGNLGNAALGREDFVAAAEYYEEARAIFQDINVGQEEIKMIWSLVKTHLLAGDEDAAVEWCNRGLARCNLLDIDVTERAYEFHRTRAEVVKTANRTKELYQYALSAILRGERKEAIQLFGQTWERRTEFDREDDVYSVVASAGVGLAAHLALLDAKELADKQGDILDAVESVADRLSYLTETLYKYLQNGETESSPEELLKAADSEDDTEISLEKMEAQAYAMLLSELQQSST